MGITDATALAALAIALSFVIERVTELLKAIYDIADARLELCHFWTRRAITIRNFVQLRMRALEYVEPAAIAGFLEKVNDVVLGPKQGYHGTIPTICGDLVRTSAIRLGAKIIGVVLGMIIAANLSMDLFAVFNQNIAYPGLGVALTGMAMGLGSGPIHKLIVALDERRARKSAEAVNAS